MKILYTATMLSHICQFHLPHLKMWQEQGYTVHVAAYNNLAVKNGLSLKYTDKYFEIPFQRSPKSPDNIRAYKLLKKLIKEEHYDVIVCNTPVGGVLTRIAAIGSGAKVIYIAHGFHFYKGASKMAWTVWYPVEKIMARFCDVLVTINEEDYAFAKEKFSTRVEHIHGLGVSTERYHSADAQTTAKMREAEGLKDTDFVVLCTGELNQNKDQRTLISAAAMLREKIPGLHVLLAGNGPLEQDLRNQIKEENLEGIVSMIGYRTDLEKVLPAVDLAVSCSHREGLGLNIIEAMLCEKPVVASINRGHTELIENGHNGYLVCAGNPEELADRIFCVFSNPHLAREMGKNGSKLAEVYTVEEVKKVLKAIIEEA